MSFTSLMMLFNFSLKAQQPCDTNLRAAIAGITSGIISKDVLLKNAELKCLNTNYEIISYILTFLKDGNISETAGEGNTFTEGMKKDIMELKSGNKLYIETIRAKRTDGKIIVLPPMNLKLK